MKTARLAATTSLLLGLAGCGACCGQGSVERDGVCVAACNEQADCADVELCLDGVCQAVSGRSSSSGGSSSASQEDGSSTSDLASSNAGSSSSGGATSARSGIISGRTYIYAHTNKVLYRMDPESLVVEQLGTLTFSDAQGGTVDTTLTDLAVSSAGEVWGCGLRTLYKIDVGMLRATYQAPLADDHTGLTFVPAGMIDPNQEVLVGATSNNGSIHQIDTVTGNTTPIGTYGNNWQTSGDVVAVLGDGMYAVVKKTGMSSDFLARLDPMTGVATIVGTQGIGAQKVYGLGYWNQVLYGFNDAGKLISINKETGVGTIVQSFTFAWWGAGVTTLAKTSN